MKVVRYTGGLGNQMFQYAFQLRMMKEYPGEKIYADLSHYKLMKEHNGFELDRVFGIRLDRVSDREARKMSPYYVPSFLMMKMPRGFREKMASHYRHKISRIKIRFRSKSPQHYYKAAGHNAYDEKTLRLGPGEDWYLDGLWQNIGYLMPCLDEIFKAFIFQNESKYSDRDRLLIQKAYQEDVTGVHIRRGDFVNSKFDICGMEYYRDAMKLMEKKVLKPYYYFFTDDVAFVEKEFAHIRHKEVIGHSVENSVLDMEMLSICKYSIISNSTFSFWAAFLNKREDRMVIAPKYSVIKPDNAYELSAPVEWITIDNSCMKVRS